MKGLVRPLMGLAMLAAFALGTPGGPARAASSLPFTVPAGPVNANPVNNLDCNGYATGSVTAVPGMKPRCVDPIAPFAYNGYPANDRFYDNGHYVGHDEPTVKFISGIAGSGNNMTYFQQLPRDPTCTPTTSPSGATCSIYNELSPAPWFGLPLCDDNSYPTLGGNGTSAPHCVPSSDANAPSSSNPTTTGAGSAFMELQFYPPGNGPWFDAPSIDQNKWSVAITIDSFEAVLVSTPAGFIRTPNPNCTEPVNVGFLTHDGIPMGPPSPQQIDDATQMETSDTLLMNPGDTLRVHLFDTAHGLETKVDDLTTGDSGFMIASATNGFMNTNPTNCQGAAYDFHTEFNTASQGNQVPWAALDGGVLMQQEIGHFEPCASLTNADPETVNYSNGDTWTDPSLSQTCNGGFEGAGGPTGAGEGPCSPGGASCMNGKTEGGGACGAQCESSDGFCFPLGSRTVTITPFGNTPQMQTWTTKVAGCTDNRYQNGDLDYDGSDYVADWPDRPDNSNGHPTSFRYMGPFDGMGNSYPVVQFETDVGLEENNCQSNGTGCTAPPAPPPSNPNIFYPFWTITNTQGLDGLAVSKSSPCVWNFGNDILGTTLNDFSKDSQYGTPSGTNTKKTLISATQSNPETTGNVCPSLALVNITPIPTGGSIPELPWVPAAIVGGVAVLGFAGYRRQRKNEA